MRPTSFWILTLVLLGLLQAPVFGQAKKEPLPEPKKTPQKEVVPEPIKIALPCGPSFKHLDGQMLVFVVNGAGGSTNASDNLIDINTDKHLGLRIKMIPWARNNSLYQDLVDTEAQLNAAAKLSCSIAAIRKDAPNAHIFLVGHSAGARVVLFAAEMAPPKSIDRIIVLHPAVASCYDLSAAIKATRYGIDNFWSSEDGILDAAAQHPRTADAVKGRAAGRAGFRLDSCDKKDIDAFHRHVRQYRWTEDYCGSGGHLAWTLQRNMKKVVVPLFFTAPCVEPLPVVIERKLPQVK